MKKVLSYLAICVVVFTVGCPASNPHLRASLHTEDGYGNLTVTDLPQISEVDAPDGALVTYENGGGFGSAEATIYLDNVPNPIVQPVTRTTKEAVIGEQKSSDIIIAAALFGIYASTCVVREDANSFDIAVPCGDNLVTLVLKVIGEDGSYVITTFRGRAYHTTPQPSVGYHLSTMVSPVGSGGISVDPNLTSYDAGTTVNLTASANNGWVFDHWTVNSVESVNRDVQAQVTMNSDVMVVAVFVQNPIPVNRYTLTTSVNGQGSVSEGGQYDAGTKVTVSATASISGWHFDHFVINGVTSTASSSQVTMSGNVSATAYFVQDAPPEVNAAGVEFTRNGSTGTLKINPGTFSLRSITADASAAYLPEGTTFADINSIGVEIVNLPSPYWYLRESSSATMTANAWSTIITLDGNGTDSNGIAKTVALANWAGGRAIPFYTLRTVPGRIFSLNTGANNGKLNSQTMAVDVVGYIWPASK